jgi:hypothetical protein
MSRMRLLVVAVLALGFGPAMAVAQNDTSRHALPRGFDRADVSAPLSAQAMERARREVAPYLSELPDVPVPRDGGGGYTHERHKDNYRLIHEAGALYALTGERAYAELVRDVLLRYAALYPGLELHPNTPSRQPGRLFWQSLNDSVWLVESIQGYADVRDALTAQERATIEQNVFRPMAEFLSVGSAATFERIHNHATWAAAGVGMTGYVLGDEVLVRRALYGLDGSGQTGFLRQIDLLFSPDGFYAEGPYYLRYAIMPFILFARTIEAYDPDRRIFSYRDGMLVRAVYNLIQQTYAGRFFPINDAMPEKGIDSPEILHAVSVVYALTQDPALLSIAREQRRVMLTPEGVALGAALQTQTATLFPFRSMRLRDGADGNDGALAIMRAGEGAGHQALVFEATAQGMGHGHFDRLSWIFYDRGREVVSDYGAARFLNVEAKEGGRYLPENETWAKETVAHNALVVDETSQFAANLRRADATGTQFLHFGARDGVTLAAARLVGAYEGVTIQRAMAVIDRPEIGHPIVLDIVRARSTGAHRYDLPLHYRGVFIDSTLAFEGGQDRLTPLGARAGYQHLWDRGRAPMGEGAQRIAWFNQDRFYSYTFASVDLDEAILAELGANDPDYNLRHERSFILRANESRDFNFVAVLEPHGQYSSSEEFAREVRASVTSVRLLQDGERDVAVIELADGARLAVGVSWNANERASHRLNAEGGSYRWTGFFGVAETGRNQRQR